MDSRLKFHRLQEQLRRGAIDRRTFMVRAFALGVSGSAVMASLSRPGLAAAQDGTPAAAGAASIGNPAIEHLTDTSKGTIKLYSSWPLTGAYEQIGGDAVEAIKLALEDFGNAAGGFALEYEALDDGIAANNGGWDAGARVRERQRGRSTMRTPWSTWRPTTPARPRSRSRS